MLRYFLSYADSVRRAKARLNQQNANCVHSQSEVIVIEHSWGHMSDVCQFCNALYWKSEINTSKKYTKCCHDGKVCLPNSTETPDLLKKILCDSSPVAKKYRLHIREYNAALAFASMGAEIKAPPGTGPYCFRIYG